METLTPIEAIRTKCLDCSCYQPKEVRLCPVTNCALWPYRMGKRPTEEVYKELLAIQAAKVSPAA